MILVLLLSATPLLYQGRAPVMGTRLEVQLVLASEADRARADADFRAVVDEFARLEALLSEWKPESPIGRLNDAGGRAIELPAEVFGLLTRSLAWSAKTSGAFDVTFASLWGLWRFDPGDEARIPSPEEAKRRAIAIDYRHVVLDEKASTARITGGSRIGLGGIAKGYAVSRAVAMLRARGWQNFFVKAGGELYLAGRKGDRPWIAGIRDPRSEADFAVLALENSAFTTSGDYEHFVMKDGVRYHHIIDPKTGYPGRASQSVTIVAPNSEDADALSTSVFVLGPVAGLKLVESLPGTEAVIITGDGKLVISSGLANKLALRESGRARERCTVENDRLVCPTAR